MDLLLGSDTTGNMMFRRVAFVHFALVMTNNTSQTYDQRCFAIS